MTDVHLPELMELDSYWENAIRDAAENTIRSRKRLECALHNRKKINKILENCRYKPAKAVTVRKCRKCDENEERSTDEDDDYAMTVRSYDTNVNVNGPGGEQDKSRSGPSPKRRRRSTPAKGDCPKEKSRACFRGRPGKKIERPRVEFARDSTDEDGEESRSPRSYSKVNPYIVKKKKLAVITAEIKRKKRNANNRRQEKRAKNLRMKSKAYKTKRPRKKPGRGSDNDDNRDVKQDQKPKNQETKADNSNANAQNGNANANEDVKKVSAAGKEVPVTKKASQNGSKDMGNPTCAPKSEKDHSKGDCSQDAKPKECDISKYGNACMKMIMDRGMLRGPPLLYAVKRSNRSCLGSRKMKCKQKRRGKKKLRPFIKFYMTVYKELCGVCSVTSIAKEAAQRWRCMSRKEKLKYYPRNYK